MTSIVAHLELFQNTFRRFGMLWSWSCRRFCQKKAHPNRIDNHHQLASVNSDPWPFFFQPLRRLYANQDRRKEVCTYIFVLKNMTAASQIVRRQSSLSAFYNLCVYFTKSEPISKICKWWLWQWIPPRRKRPLQNTVGYDSIPPLPFRRIRPRLAPCAHAESVLRGFGFSFSVWARVRRETGFSLKGETDGIQTTILPTCIFTLIYSFASDIPLD